MNRGTGANLPGLRGHNAALLLGLLRGAGAEGLGRGELAARTGLTPQAVSKITARLRGDGLVAEAGRGESTGGKPRTLLRLVPEAGHAVGVHLDRDALRVVRVDLAGRVVAEVRSAVDFGWGPDAVADAVVGAVGEVCAGASGLAARGLDVSDVDVSGVGPSDVDLSGVGLSDLGLSGVDPSDVGLAGAGLPDVGLLGAGLPGVEPAVAVPVGAGVRTPGRLRAALPDVLGVLGVGVAAPGPLDRRTGVLGRVTGHPEWEGFELREVLAERLGVPVELDKDTNAGAAAAADAGRPGPTAYVHVGTGIGAGLLLDGEVYRGRDGRSAAGEFGHQVLMLDGPPCRCGARGCVEVLCLAAVARGDVAEAARVLGEAVANLVALLDVERVLLGGRVVEADPAGFVTGVARAVRARGTAEVLPARVGVAEGAAELVLAPLFGGAG
ncbi:ROK family transcriptional regulator [Streptomyces sp. NPDC089799]|uniref:ROK family transcriptional regulator n=1 Tax=Streptomyces sp. NPDC089799 TaxID=3155066 RepID=UPI003418CE9C